MYYKSDELIGQAHILLAMICANVGVQSINVLIVYRKKSWTVKLTEILICITFLRPAVDAYRVSTNHQDDKIERYDPLVGMIYTKCTELATESVPGCVFQLYVWLKYPDQAGQYALVSIFISMLTTGITSAMISLDLDVDTKKRKNNPEFYGYVPDDHAKRGR